jgi:hypothetical protein
LPWPMRRSFLVPLSLLLTFVSAPDALGQARGVKVQNLPNFDLRRFHFGFLISPYNTSDFFMELKPQAPFTDSVLVIDHVKQPGFNLGIVASLNMTNNLSLRLLPSLSFQYRSLSYQFRPANSTQVARFDKPVESTYLEFPLLLKMRSDRINNFAVYVIAGGKFSIDMATKKDVDNAIDEDIVVKIERNDYSAEAGGGVDLFLPYFKLGIELKAAFGCSNVLIDDGTRFSVPLASLRTKVWALTFTFEG